MLNTKSIPKGATLTVIFSLIVGKVRYYLLKKSQPHDQSGSIHGHSAQNFYLAGISLARQKSILSACVAPAVIRGLKVEMRVVVRAAGVHQVNRSSSFSLRKRGEELGRGHHADLAV